MTSIHARPVEVAERTEVGHWEGDLVTGRRPTAVATLVERQTRFVRLVPLPHGLKADAVRPMPSPSSSRSGRLRCVHR